jgi:hypothetical protein
VSTSVRAPHCVRTPSPHTCARAAACGDRPPITQRECPPSIRVRLRRAAPSRGEERVASKMSPVQRRGGKFECAGAAWRWMKHFY